MKENLYDESCYSTILARINNLNASSIPIWGKMSIAQMLAHCATVLDTYNGDLPFGKVNWIARLFKKMVYQVVVGDKPYGKGGPTLPQFKIVEDKEFHHEKERLLTALEKFYTTDEQVAARLKHPLFGKLSRPERGWAMYKHLNHHLEQFGV